MNKTLQHPAAYAPAQAEEEAPTARFTPAQRTLADIIADLSKPLPDRLIQHKPRRNKRTGQERQLAFINWRTVQRLLDLKAPGWCGQVTTIALSANRCAVSYELTIPTADAGHVTRAATGTDDEDDEGYGDPITNAEQQAFKRAATRFGLGLYLYDRK
ncbi:MAG: hypothetical protein IVW51_17590 [Thermaceae bacterium]|nr:hypothetical protein [Thermaceae bacterium]